MGYCRVPVTSTQQTHPRPTASPVAVFDLDGTLIDSDAPLLGAFEALGVPAESVTWGHVVADECQRLGISLQEYLEAYDLNAAQPFDGAAELVEALDRWGVVSNKHPDLGYPELQRLGWTPEVALFSDAFDGPKQLGPALTAMGLDAHNVLFVGDTSHDRACAHGVGARFAWAGWNPRATPDSGDTVLTHPAQVLEVLATMSGHQHPGA